MTRHQAPSRGRRGKHALNTPAIGGASASGARRRAPRIVHEAAGDDSERRERRRGGRALGQDVGDGDAAGEQMIGDDPAMAAPPHRLGAHDRDRPGQPEQPGQAGAELGGERVVGVVAEARVVPGVVGQPRRAPWLAAPAAARRCVLANRPRCRAVHTWTRSGQPPPAGPMFLSAPWNGHKLNNH